MADVIKVLGQYANPTSEQTLYTAPNLSQVTCSTLVVCNRTSGQLTFRVSVSQAGAATDNKDYLFYDAPLNANSTLTLTIGMTLAQSDVVRIDGSATGLSFNLFGVETSA
jgi:hypothetical protein